MFDFGALGRRLQEITNNAKETAPVTKAPPIPAAKTIIYRPVSGVTLPPPNEGEEDFHMDHLNYVFNHQVNTTHFALPITDRKRSLIIDYAFSVFANRRRPLESFFLAVHIIDNTIQSHKKTLDTARDQDIATMVIAAVDIGSKCEYLHGVAHHFVDGYDTNKIRMWEREHLRLFKFNISHTHCLHFLRVFQFMTHDLMAEKNLQGAWTLMKALGCLAMAHFTTAKQQPSLLAAAVARVTFEMLHQRGIIASAEPSVLLHLHHVESEHLPVAIALVEWLQACPKPIVSNIAKYYADEGVQINDTELRDVLASLRMALVRAELTG